MIEALIDILGEVVLWSRDHRIAVAAFVIALALIGLLLAADAYPNPSDTLPSVGISSPGSSTGTLM
jgi:uncharacterized membrane protein YdfJ with MMPL/SSD domain